MTACSQVKLFSRRDLHDSDIKPLFPRARVQVDHRAVIAILRNISECRDGGVAGLLEEMRSYVCSRSQMWSFLSGDDSDGCSQSGCHDAVPSHCFCHASVVAARSPYFPSETFLHHKICCFWSNGGS